MRILKKIIFLGRIRVSVVAANNCVDLGASSTLVTLIIYKYGKEL
jgi:hypothetical protein